MNLEGLETYFCNNKFERDTIHTSFTGSELHLMVGTVAMELNEYEDELTEKGISRAKEFLVNMDDEEFYIDHIDESFDVDITYDDISIIITSIKHCFERDDYSIRAYMRAVKLIARFAKVCVDDYEEAL